MIGRFRQVGFWCLLLVLAAGVAPAAGSSPGSEGVVEVTVLGTAPIQSGDLVTARNQALEQGLNNAVQRALEQMIPRQSLASGLAKLGDVILLYGQGLVKEYRILAQDQTRNLYIMLLTVSLLRKDLENTLTAAGFQTSDRNDAPSVLLLLQGPDSGGPKVKQVLMEVLTNMGYRPVDPGAHIHDVSALSTITRADLGRQRDADLVLYGSWDISCGPSPETSRIIRCSADVDFQWIDVSTSMLAHRSRAQTYSEEPDLRTARLKAAQGLSDAVTGEVRAWAERSTDMAEKPSTRLKVTLENVRRFQVFEQVRDALQNRVPGVQSVQLRSVIPGEFDLFVQFLGVEEELIQRLASVGFEGFAVTTRMDPQRGVILTVLSP